MSFTPENTLLAVILLVMAGAVFGFWWMARGINRTRPPGAEQRAAAIVFWRAEVARFEGKKNPKRRIAALFRLGGALFDAGRRDPGREMLDQAKAAYLEVINADGRSRVSVLARINLAPVLMSLGQREAGTQSLDAVHRLLADLAVARKSIPGRRNWFAVRSNLASVQASLGARRSDAAELEAAMAASRVVLAEGGLSWTGRDRTYTLESLANGLCRLGRFKDDPSYFEGADARSKESLKLVTRRKYPGQWALLRATRCRVLALIAGQRQDRALLDEALAAVTDALETCPRPDHAVRWSGFACTLAETLTLLGEAEDSAQHYRDAIAAARAALEVATQAEMPFPWSDVSLALGAALRGLGELSGETAPLEEARDVLEAADAFLERMDAGLRRRQVTAELGRVQNALQSRKEKGPVS